MAIEDTMPVIQKLLEGDLKPHWLGDFYRGELNIRCPACGSDYSHIREVYTACGSGSGVDTGPYTGTVEKGHTPADRSALVIEFDGECGHRFVLVIQQHKGINQLFVEGHEGGKVWRGVTAKVRCPGCGSKAVHVGPGVPGVPLLAACGMCFLHFVPPGCGHPDLGKGTGCDP